MDTPRIVRLLTALAFAGAVAGVLVGVAHDVAVEGWHAQLDREVNP